MPNQQRGTCILALEAEMKVREDLEHLPTEAGFCDSV